jgi:hypothetical protein
VKPSTSETSQLESKGVLESLSSSIPEADSDGEDIENQVSSVAGLLAADAENGAHDTYNFGNDADDYSLCFDEGLDESGWPGWESQNDAYMAIPAAASSSDDDMIIEDLPPAAASSSDDDMTIEDLPPAPKSSSSIRKPKKSLANRKSAKTRRVQQKRQGKRSVARDVELSDSESNSETDPKTCSKWVIICLWL